MSLYRSQRPLAAVGAVAILVVLLASCSSVLPAHADDNGLAVQVLAGQTLCFHEDAPGVGVKMFLHYMVTSGAALDIDCKILAPDKSLVWESERSSEDRVLFKSRMTGSYAFCFSNRMSTLTSKVVSFSVMVGDGDAPGASPSKEGKTDALQRSIKRLQKGLHEIMELQDFLSSREQRHRATAEVGNTRVVLFCFLEILFIVGMGVGSVIYLRRMFVTKRMV
ncbi:hypothetical protein JKF63_02565 [Porcisia hertigi]|uniref:GOLD domain-containing protein n=1 Tax=Porcisia hertigi TaxID=2761500 RepID=A0A836L2W6_9TRYP|nr:hypothetical protein JKF63_02565 [Porcisia hertigi]